MGDISYEAAGVGFIFAADCRVGVGEYMERNEVVYIGDDGEVVEAGLDEDITGCHCRGRQINFVTLGVLASGRGVMIFGMM